MRVAVLLNSKWRAAMRSWALILIALLLDGAVNIGRPSAALAQATTVGEEAQDHKAFELQSDVVKIVATLGQGASAVVQEGFGFIVGEQGDKLVLVTANHVVRSKDAEDRAPQIYFFENQGTHFTGTLEPVYLGQDEGDLAVVLVPNPHFKLVTEAIDPAPCCARGRRVWEIGRQGSWSVQIAPASVLQILPNGVILVEGLLAADTSSGGPLVSSNGIVGMIVGVSGFFSESRPIDLIRKQVSEEWHYPWQLGAATPSRPGVVTPAQFPAAAEVTETPPPPPAELAVPVPASSSATPAAPGVPQEAASSELSVCRGPANENAGSLICDSPSLWQLGGELDNSWRQLPPDRRQQLLGGQREWLRQQNACEGDSTCVERGNRRSLSELEANGAEAPSSGPSSSGGEASSSRPSSKGAMLPSSRPGWCRHKGKTAVEVAVCENAGLWELEARLKAAWRQLAPAMRSEQSKIDWWKQRDACKNDNNISACIARVYRSRISELQAG
jgi:uncharacterized protein